MKHPGQVNFDTKGNDYSVLMIEAQIPEFMDVLSDLSKTTFLMNTMNT
jgi:hypothetical protein